MSRMRRGDLCAAGYLRGGGREEREREAEKREKNGREGARGVSELLDGRPRADQRREKQHVTRHSKTSLDFCGKRERLQRGGMVEGVEGVHAMGGSMGAPSRCAMARLRTVIAEGQLSLRIQIYCKILVYRSTQYVYWSP